MCIRDSSKDEEDNTGAIPEAGLANEEAGKPDVTDDADGAGGKAVAQANQTSEE